MLSIISKMNVKKGKTLFALILIYVTSYRTRDFILGENKMQVTIICCALHNKEKLFFYSHAPHRKLNGQK